ncbi:MAG TPA: CocE/NonD family hydrolase, partial [Alphaproteobacteria bacterium]|nr:CocE/NonD family hydrolase [Alphaproteobacteria bacterium]
MMTYRTAFPFAVRTIEHVVIPLSDGTQLSARIWMPEGANAHPVPAILEYMPYRKRDHNRNRDEMAHGYFAGHGYACLRVDTRGSGESDGVLTDEFTRQQTDDGVEIVNWIAAQPWCSGSVGMIGKSWSGFSSLQVAARAPEALKAVIPVCAGVDRYRHGLHFRGGCLLLDNLHWTTTMLMFNMRPPDPQIVGDRYDAIWRQRIEGNEPWLKNWLTHQTDDGYYREGSAVHDIAKFRAAIYFVGGWFDHFAGAVPEAIESFSVPVRGLVGPWAHHFGHDGEPGPRMGWLQDCLRWWDQFLKGKDTGVLREPAYNAWILEPPAHPAKDVPCKGRWVSEPTWPSPNIQRQDYFLGDGTLGKKPSQDKAFAHRSPLSLGMANGGDYCRLGVIGEAPLDQREDDARSLVFESEVLTERVEILGSPTLKLTVAADAKVAMVAVRLNDVAPDGTSSRVTYGFLNLTHRDSHANPAPLEPGKPYTVSVDLNHIG